VACLFCQIAGGEVPANVVYHRDGVTAFLDRAPQAPTHVLVIPDEHIDGAAAVAAEHEQIVGRLVRVAAEVARESGIEESGYRLIINQGHDAGQTVEHIHLHLLGGRPLPTPLV
jgi:histidine triad (HIT) family protein